MATNRLTQEKSPYLLQHAANPVDWYPWGPEAFDKARREDKPIFLSVGYSTCHWCHVMERESFENPAIAEVLNKHFVPVKVDREERPDVDRIYMLFVQATTGSGGWPMSVFLTPELEPFFGGTYFPPDNRYGRPGFAYILERLAAAWNTERSRIVESAREVTTKLRDASAFDTSALVITPAVLDSGFYAFRRIYDSDKGGFGGAPKFPRPAVHNFLVRYYARTGNPEALESVVHTLRAMALGGMNDQLGGGFHRYSVDAEWFVPHFEKMLYDQAQLAVSYLETWQITGHEELAASARDIFTYVLRDMTSPEGGFYSAEDADSVIDPEHPHEKGEGAFYVWSWEELEQHLGEEPARWFAFRYGAEPGGNVSPQQDPHNEFTSRNILFAAHTVQETAERFGRSREEMESFFAQAREILLAARAKRIRPGLDDKILTAWNGLMISAFALGARLLNEPEYGRAAQRSADFVRDRLWNQDTGTLLRRFRDGEAAIEGFLDDYAFFAQGLIDLYETTFDPEYLGLAIAITRETLRRFEDPDSGGFFSTAAGASDLILRAKDDYDGAEPSGNSVAIRNLQRLARLAGDTEFDESASRALRAFAPRLQEVAYSLPQMLVAADFALSEPQEIVVAGDRSDSRTSDLLHAIRQRFLPRAVLHLVDDQNREALSAMVPQMAAMSPVDGRPAVYVCRNFACQLPVTAVDELGELLR